MTTPHPFLPLLDGREHPDTPLARAVLTLLGGLGRIYGGLQMTRAFLYRSGVLTTHRAPCPVISVGNLTTGGTGKTPMVLWLARRLLAAGARVAVVSRGYRQRSRAPVTVVADREGIRLAPPEAADEAYLLASLLPGVVVLTGRDRPALVRDAVERFRCGIVLMDDGFQRLDVARDLNLLLLDAAHPFGNGALLPGGLLREFPSALRRCDLMILTRADDHPEATRRTRERLERLAPGKPILTASHRPTAWVLHPPDDAPRALPLASLPGPALAFCAIATPERFRQSLEGLGIRPVAFHPFPDHFFFGDREIAQLTAAARARGATALVCTEKDAVKLNPATLPLPLYALRVEMRLQEEPQPLEAFIRILLEKECSFRMQP